MPRVSAPDTTGDWFAPVSSSKNACCWHCSSSTRHVNPAPQSPCANFVLTVAWLLASLPHNQMRKAALETIQSLEATFDRENAPISKQGDIALYSLVRRGRRLSFLILERLVGCRLGFGAALASPGANKPARRIVFLFQDMLQARQQLRSEPDVIRELRKVGVLACGDPPPLALCPPPKSLFPRRWSRFHCLAVGMHDFGVEQTIVTVQWLLCCRQFWVLLMTGKGKADPMAISREDYVELFFRCAEVLMPEEQLTRRAIEAEWHNDAGGAAMMDLPSF